MKTIKYTVDRGFRKAGEVRTEEDAVADNLIHRGFAEATEEETDETAGDGSAVDQYHPEGQEADPESRGGAQPLPAELNAPGVSGSNVRASRKTARPAAASDPEAEGTEAAPTLTSDVSVGQRTDAGEAEDAGASDTTEGDERTDAEKQGSEQQS